MSWKPPDPWSYSYLLGLFLGVCSLKPGRAASTNRRIVLADWQRAIVDAHPEQFVRGLIHSDGRRVINRFKTKLPCGRFIGPKL